MLGGSCRFSFNERHGVSPEKSSQLKKLIRVGTIDEDKFEAVQEAIRGQEVNNEEPGWNCQYWVKEALDALVEGELVEVDEEGMAYVEERVGKFTADLPDEDKSEEEEEEEGEEEEDEGEPEVETE